MYIRGFEWDSQSKNVENQFLPDARQQRYWGLVVGMNDHWNLDDAKRCGFETTTGRSVGIGSRSTSRRIVSQSVEDLVLPTLW